MNNETLKTDFPKCYKKLLEYYDLDENLLNANYKYFLEDYLGRNLYDFFDDNGIVLTPDWITGDYELNIKSFFEVRIYLKIELSDEPKIMGSPHRDRTIAEESGFEAAFELLESRL